MRWRTAIHDVAPRDRAARACDGPTMTDARKLPDDHKSAPKGPSIFELVNQGLEGVDVEGFVLAAKKYGDDHARELADLEAGHHPLQRKRAR